jgi:hypothetical protein
MMGETRRFMERARCQALAADDWYWANGDPTQHFAQRLTRRSRRGSGRKLKVA